MEPLKEKSLVSLCLFTLLDIFRPFPGYKSVRLVPRETKNDGTVLFCFADFENEVQTTMIINTLQGYRFDKDDIEGLHFSYAKKH